MKHERALRRIAWSIAIIWAALAVAALFRHRDPRDAQVTTIVARLVFYGALSGIFVRSARASKVDASGWLGSGFLASVSLWEARDRMGGLGMAAFVSLAALSFLGHAIDRHHLETAQRAGAADGASRR